MASDLVTLERSIFRRTFAHGLVDIALACIVALFAVGPFVTSSGLGDVWGSVVFVPFWAVAALLLRYLHRHLVRPRLGHVDFAEPRKHRLRRWNATAFALAVLGLGAGATAAASFGALPSSLPVVAFSCLVLVGLMLAGYFLQLRRFYLYAVVIGSAPWVGELLWRHANVPHHGFPVTFGFSAALCLLVGVGLFVRFIARYPLPPDELSPRDPALS